MATILDNQLDDYMKYGWKPVLKKHSAGGFRLTVQHLDDFEMFGSRARLLDEWKTALRGHLRVYLKNQKRIPIPAFSVKERSDVQTFSGSNRGQLFLLSEGLSVVNEVPLAVR